MILLLAAADYFAQSLSDSLTHSSNVNYKTVSDTFRVGFENAYRLSNPAVIPSTLKLSVNGENLKNKFYRFVPDSNSVILSDKIEIPLFDTLVVSYRALKIPLKKKYFKHKLISRWDDKFKDTVSVLKNENLALTPESIFGKQLKKNGTIIRGITVGTNSGAQLKSGLRLELSGKLSENVEIVAALTDQNSPIQPEGVTERLNEIDKVFIKLKHPYGEETFGDYYLNKNLGMFSKVNRKLQGVKGEFGYKDYKGFAAFASQRGKFTSNNFQGVDGVQGPYRLYGANNERNIIVIAGTEAVFVDGIKMIRGENNDYTIDYSNASIVFKAKRLITSASRIYVEFQYTDRKFERTFQAASASARLFGSKLIVNSSYFSENDDENNPIDFTFTDEEKNILKNAGNDINKAVVSGVKLAPEDSSGRRNGIYSKRDTLIDGKDYTIYMYAPGSESAIYFVTFSFVGEGKGDYKMISFAQYVFAGIGQGSYLPVKFLPMPEKKQIGDINFVYSPSNWLSLKGEFAGSFDDKNKFSTLDDSENFGFARNFEVILKHDKIPYLGRASLTFSDRYVDAKFSPLERIDNVEFNRDYNITASQNSGQLKREATISVKPEKNITLFANYGLVKYSDSLYSDRYNFGFKYDGIDKYSIKFNNNYVSSLSNGIKNSFLDQKGSGAVRIWKLKTGFEFERDKKNNFLKSADSLINESHDYVDISPFIESGNIFGFKLKYKYSLRNEKEPLNNVLIEKSFSGIHELGLTFSGARSFATSVNLAFRKKEYTESWKKAGFGDNESILIRSLSKINLFSRFITGNFFYNAATEKAAKLQKIFIPVPVGTGNYIYLGDINSNGIADENEFEQTNINGNYIATSIPTDELFPVINLQLSTRWKFDFAKIFKYKSLAKTFLAPISGETFLRIDEKSKIAETEKIYLLNLPYFMNDSTTINGSNIFQQDIYLFRFSSSLSVRGRFLQKRYLRQYSNGLVFGFKREKSLRFRAKLAREIRYQADYMLTDDNLNSGTNFSRSHTARTEELDSDFSYRPYSNFELGFKFGIGKTIDVFPIVPIEINYNSQTVRLDFSFVGKGRIRFSVERTELLSNVEDYKVPWEISQGKRVGKNYAIRLNVDYKLSKNLQSTLVYTGIKYGQGEFIHTMRAEARAYF